MVLTGLALGYFVAEPLYLIAAFTGANLLQSSLLDYTCLIFPCQDAERSLRRSRERQIILSDSLYTETQALCAVMEYSLKRQRITPGLHCAQHKARCLGEDREDLAHYTRRLLGGDTMRSTVSESMH